MRIEEEFENVMLNIEMQVVSVANREPSLSDVQVEKVYNAFISKYKALLSGRDAKQVSFASATAELYTLMNGFCDFFTGDSEVWGEGDYILELDVEKVSYEDMIAIFKRLRKSLNTWTKRGGSRGYIYYISQFIQLPSHRSDEQNPVSDNIIDAGLKQTDPAKYSIGKRFSSLFKK